MAIAEPTKFEFKPLPIDEWLYVVIDSKPVDEVSRFDENKKTIKVTFRVEQDAQIENPDTGAMENARGRKIPRYFPLSWPSATSKRTPLLFEFVEKVSPDLAVRNVAFDTDVLEGLACQIMVEEVKREDGTLGQKVTRFKGLKKSVTVKVQPPESAAPKKAEKVKAAAKVKTEEAEIDY